MTTIEERIRAAAARHPDWSHCRLARALWRYRVTVDQVRQALGAARDTAVGPAAAYSVKSLLEQFDDVGRLRRYLEAMPRDEYRPDDELRRELRVPPERWRCIVQHPSVTGWRYRLPNQRWVWLHPRQQEILNNAIAVASGKT